MSLLSVEATDFCAFGHFKHNLYSRGLVWVGGDNRDSKAAKSNGASKTGFFKTISWGLFGQTIDGHDGDEVIREGTKKAEVTIGLDDNAGDPYMIIRSRRKASPKLELYFGSSTEPIPGSKDEIQAQINRLVGMDFDTFRNVVLYGQRDMARFIAPSTSDTDRKKILQAILRTQIYSKGHDWTKERLADIRGKCREQEVKIENAEGRAEEYDLEALKLDVSVWVEDNRIQIEAKKQQAREAIANAKRLVAEAPKTVVLERELETLRKRDKAKLALEMKLDVISNEVGKLWVEGSEIAANARAAQKDAVRVQSALDQFKDGTCPVCASPADGVDVKRHLKSVHAEKDSIEKRIVELGIESLAKLKEHKAKKSEADATEVMLETFGRIDVEIADKRAEIERAKSSKALAAAAINRAQELLVQAKAQAALENPHTKRLETAKDRLKALKAEIFVATSELKLLREELRHYEFWNKGFGPTGLPSFVLDSIMPYLTERTNHYLETLSDGDITMNFSTQSELKSAKGEIRDKIAITWEAEGTTNKPLSGGQYKKCEIATTLAMMDLVATRDSAPLDLLLLDEALDGVDEEGYSRIIDLLHKLRSSRKSIFVISHSSEIGEIFERGILVVKEGGIARIEDVA